MADESQPSAAEVVFDHVTKRYPGRAEPAVDDLSLTIPAGEICMLVGPSGGGKTTALKLVNRLIDFDEGVRDPGNPVRMLPAYDCGDHLHPSDAGYNRMGDIIDLTLFDPAPT